MSADAGRNTRRGQENSVLKSCAYRSIYRIAIATMLDSFLRCWSGQISSLLGGLEVGIRIRSVLGEVETIDLLLVRGTDADAELDEGEDQDANDE